MLCFGRQCTDLCFEYILFGMSTDVWIKSTFDQIVQIELNNILLGDFSGGLTNRLVYLHHTPLIYIDYYTDAPRPFRNRIIKFSICIFFPFSRRDSRLHVSETHNVRATIICNSYYAHYFTIIYKSTTLLLLLLQLPARGEHRDVYSSVPGSKL